MKVREWLGIAGLCYGVVGAAMLILPGWEDWETWQLWLAWAASPLIVAAICAGALAVQALFFITLVELTKKR